MRQFAPCSDLCSDWIHWDDNRVHWHCAPCSLGGLCAKVDWTSAKGTEFAFRLCSRRQSSVYLRYKHCSRASFLPFYITTNIRPARFVWHRMQIGLNFTELCKVARWYWHKSFCTFGTVLVPNFPLGDRLPEWLTAGVIIFKHTQVSSGRPFGAWIVPAVRCTPVQWPSAGRSTRQSDVPYSCTVTWSCTDQTSSARHWGNQLIWKSGIGRIFC